MRMNRDNGQSPERVDFRLDTESYAVLAQRADRLGISHNLLARQYLMEVLQESEEREALREAVVTLQKNFLLLREDMKTSAIALLCSAGSVEEEQARAWAEEHLNPS